MFVRSFRRSLRRGATLLIALSAPAFAAAPDCTTYQLDFVPYSSSYLSTKKGDLVRRRPGVPASARRELPPEPVRASRRLTIVEKFLEARSGVLEGKTMTLGELRASAAYREARATYYKPKAEHWEGYCDRWTSGALDPELVRTLGKFDVAVCGGVVFTGAELKELASAIYPYRQVSGDPAAGVRTEEEPSAKLREYSNRFGIDSLRADVMDATAIDRLSHNQGFAFDVDSGPEVWNQPVYRMDRCVEKLDADHLPAAARRRGIPAIALRSSSPVMNDFLERLRSAEYYLQSQMGYLENGTGKRGASAIERFGRRAYEAYFHLGDGQLAEIRRLDPELAIVLEQTRRDENFFVLRGSWAHRLPALLRKKLVQAEPGLEVERVRSTFHFKSESEFNQNADPSEKLPTDYVIYRLGGQTLASTWLTPLADRPDRLWTSRPDETPEYSDFKRLLDRCFSRAELDFARLYYAVAKEGHVSPESAAQLERAYAELPSTESQAQVLRILDTDVAGMPNFRAIAQKLAPASSTGTNAQ